MDIDHRALQYRLQDADETLKGWLKQADALNQELTIYAAEVATDENLSETGRLAAVREKQEELSAQLEPLRVKIAKRIGNLREQEAANAPTMPDPLHPEERGRLVEAYKRDPSGYLKTLSQRPQMAQALAEEPIEVTGITPQTKDYAKRLVQRLDNPADLEATQGKLATATAGMDYLEYTERSLKK